MTKRHCTIRRGGLLAALLGVALAAAPAAAQDCEPPGKATSSTMPICNMFPKVNVTPSSMSTGQPSVPVTISATDHYSSENFASFKIELDGINVTSQWGVTTTESGQGTTGASRTFNGRGTVALSVNDPVDTLAVTLCDLEHCTVQEKVYTLAQPGVRVEQDGQTVWVDPVATRQAVFKVFNTGTAAATFGLVVDCRNLGTGAPVSPCSLASDSVRVAAGDSAAVSATFNSSLAGGLVRVSLRAQQRDALGVQDAGWLDVAMGGIVGTAALAAQVRLVPLNAAINVERNRCVTLPTGPRTAYECGNLRIAHALPAFARRSQTWAPSLVYNSQDAHPRPTVYADVTMPSGASRPSSVDMVVTLQNGTEYRATFSASGFTAGMTRRMGLQWDGIAMPTGLYSYTVQVVTYYTAGAQFSQPVTGELVVVNRAASPFGAGWALAGVERVSCAASCQGAIRMLWVGGDGSTRVYEPAAGLTGTWVAQNSYGRPDTLTAVAGGGYQRRLPDGGRAEYDAAGLHTRSVTRLGDVTTIVYGANGVARIEAPGGTQWTMGWDNAAQLVRSISASAPGAATRTTQISIDAKGRTSALVDPDTRRVSLFYLDSIGRQVARVDDRQGARVYYLYNSLWKLKSSRIQMGTGASGANDVTTVYVPIEAQGVAYAGQTGVPAPHLGQAYTRVDGPRTDVKDVTLFWHADNGAVRLARDPLGAETYVEFDSRFSSLPVRVTSPTGMVTRMHYDARGRADTVRAVDVTGDGRDHVVTHRYDDRWDAPVETRGYQVWGGAWTLLPGGSSHAAYDPATGNPLWTQQGDDTGRRVTYRYYVSGVADGLPASVRRASGAPGVEARDSVIYDARGNAARTINPLGHMTLGIRDVLGRDSVTFTPTTAAGAADEAGLMATGVRREVIYDVMNRPVQVVTVGPALAHAGANDPVLAQTGPDTLFVTLQYDGEGRTLNVTRRARPNVANTGTLSTTYTYDVAGRVLTETSGPAGQPTVRELQYGLGGKVMERTPRGHQVWSEHDVLGRLVRRIVPEVTYPAECPSGTSPCQNPYPVYANGIGAGLAIPEEWTTFRYDLAGNLVLAENGDAVIKRTYDRVGKLRYDSVYIRSVDGNDFTQHRYGIQHGYGVTQRSSLQHPLNLAGSEAAAWEEFGYAPATGAMGSMSGRLGHSFEFKRNLAGQLTSVRGPGFTDSTTYDAGGRPLHRTEWRDGWVVLNDDHYLFDARGKLTQVTLNGSSQFNQWYSGLGMLVGTDWQNWFNGGRDREAYGMDALGNMAWRRPQAGISPSMDVVFNYEYAPGQGRVSRIWKANEGIPSTTFLPEESTRRYDGSGNVEWSVLQHREPQADWYSAPVTHERRGRSYYDATERLRYFQEREITAGDNPRLDGVWEEYRYDALGRRVLVNTRTKGLCADTGAFECASATTRTIWSGDRVLWEIRGPSESTGEVAGPSAAYGTVSYTYGVGNRPLMITKGGVSIIPHSNWRGQFSSGTYANGVVSDCPPGVTSGCEPIKWPGWRTTAWHADATEPQIETWWGGHVNGMRGANGLMYMQNRSYDPGTGQFTQGDPIGLAGGLNLYGYAAGDPVNNYDPTGYAPEPVQGGPCKNREAHNTCSDPVVLGPVIVSARINIRRTLTHEPFNFAQRHGRRSLPQARSGGIRDWFTLPSRPPLVLQYPPLPSAPPLPETDFGCPVSFLEAYNKSQDAQGQFEDAVWGGVEGAIEDGPEGIAGGVVKGLLERVVKGGAGAAWQKMASCGFHPVQTQTPVFLVR